MNCPHCGTPLSQEQAESLLQKRIEELEAENKALNADDLGRAHIGINFIRAGFEESYPPPQVMIH